MQGRHGQDNDHSDQSSDPKSPSLNGTGKYPSLGKTGRHPAFSGTGKHPIFNGTGKVPSIYATGKYPSIDGTSKQRAIPQRPPGMARVNTPPEMPRVPRPHREAPQPQKLRKGFILVGSALAVVALFAFAIGAYLFNALSVSSGPSGTATSFLAALQSKDYPNSYKYLGPAITLSTPETQFKKQAESLDSCYGAIKTYKEVPNSALFMDNTQSYTYEITRDKLTKPYQIKLKIQQDPEDQKWKITNYGQSLGPKDAPACKK